MKLAVMGLCLIALPILAQAPPPPNVAATTLSKLEVAELKNVQLTAQLVQDLGVQIATLQQQTIPALQEKQRTMSADQTKAYADLRKEVEEGHPGFTLDDYGNVVTKAQAAAESKAKTAQQPTGTPAAAPAKTTSPIPKVKRGVPSPTGSSVHQESHGNNSPNIATPPAN